MNVKQTGEDLEAWCDNEVNSYMQNGLFNCTWEKITRLLEMKMKPKVQKLTIYLKFMLVKFI